MRWLFVGEALVLRKARRSPCVLVLFPTLVVLCTHHVLAFRQHDGEEGAHRIHGTVADGTKGRKRHRDIRDEVFWSCLSSLFPSAAPPGAFAGL